MHSHAVGRIGPQAAMRSVTTDGWGHWVMAFLPAISRISGNLKRRRGAAPCESLAISSTSQTTTLRGALEKPNLAKETMIKLVKIMKNQILQPRSILQKSVILFF